MPLAEQTRQAEILAREAEYYQAEREVIAAAREMVTGISPWSSMGRLRNAVAALNAMEAAAARQISADRLRQEPA